MCYGSLRLRMNHIAHCLSVYHQILTAWHVGSLPWPSHSEEDWKRCGEKEPETGHISPELQRLHF